MKSQLCTEKRKKSFLLNLQAVKLKDKDIILCILLSRRHEFGIRSCSSGNISQSGAIAADCPGLPSFVPYLNVKLACLLQYLQDTVGIYIYKNLMENLL